MNGETLVLVEVPSGLALLLANAIRSGNHR